MCVCVCVCVCARARVCVRARALYLCACVCEREKERETERDILYLTLQSLTDINNYLNLNFIHIQATMQHLAFLALLCLSLVRFEQAMPLPPPSLNHHLQPLPDDAATLPAHAPEPLSEQPVFVVDGVPLDKIPRRLLSAALLSEKRRSRAILPAAPAAAASGATEPRRQLRVATEGPDMNALAFCRADDVECIKMMEEYEQWREDNGYGLVGGRWG